MPRSPRLGKTLNGSIVPEQGQQGNPPVPEEAVEIILISLCHLGTKGNRVDTKRKGASSTMGVEVKVSHVGDFQESCARLTSKDSPQLCENPGGVSSHSQISDFHPIVLVVFFKV